MEIFTKRSIAQKIIIMLVVVILFNFVSPRICLADETASTVGGILFAPIQSFLLVIADGAMNMIQNLSLGTVRVPKTDDDNKQIKDENDNIVYETVQQEVPTLFKISNEKSGLDSTLGIVAGVLLGIGVVVGTIATGGALGGALIAALVVGTAAGFTVSSFVASWIPPTFYLPMYMITPEEIFSNKLGMLDVNFFSPNEFDDLSLASGSNVKQESVAEQLQSMVSGAYFLVRNVAIIGLLSILVYIGIRIIISSSAQDKAKYKQRFLDWIIAMFLIFFLHYVMNFAVTMVQYITEALNSQNKQIMVLVRNQKFFGR